MRRRRFLLAPDSYKGCLSSAEVAKAMAAPLLHAGHEIICLPLSDGGEGMLDALHEATGMQLVTVSIHNPLGRKITARFGIMSDGTAVIESAEACGYSLLSAIERNPVVATSAGLGELISAAYGYGCRNFIVGLGGTCTSDSGAGMIEKLRTSVSALPDDCRFTLAVDVDAPLLGPRGATYTFARQKGATEHDLEYLEERARRFAIKSRAHTGRDMSSVPGAGAAGGLGYAFLEYFNAEVRSGAELMLGLLDFDASASGCDIVITGEGKSDAQTLMGKLPFAVMQHAREQGAEGWLVSGQVEDAGVLHAQGFTKVEAITPPSMPLSEALIPSVARSNIEKAILRLQKSEL